MLKSPMQGHLTRTVHKLYTDPFTGVFLCVQLIYNHITHMIRLQMAMGRNIPDAGTVDDEMFDEFMQSDIMPLLDYGTIIDGIGFWKGEQEQTKILYVEIPESEFKAMYKVFVMIAAAYKTAFRQDAVMISQIQTEMALV